MVAMFIPWNEKLPKLRSVHSSGYMQGFLHGFPCLWDDRKYWDVDKSVLSLNHNAIFEEYNALMKKMLYVAYLMLDESMSEWRLKTSKRGGLPHISHEQQETSPLETMIRYASGSPTGIFVHHDIVISLLDNGLICIPSLL